MELTDDGRSSYFQVTTSVRTVRDDCARADDRACSWLSMVLVLLLMGDVLSLPIFISISSERAKTEHDFINIDQSSKSKLKADDTCKFYWQRIRTMIMHFIDSNMFNKKCLKPSSVCLSGHRGETEQNQINRLIFITYKFFLLNHQSGWSSKETD